MYEFKVRFGAFGSLGLGPAPEFNVDLEFDVDLEFGVDFDFDFEAVDLAPPPFVHFEHRTLSVSAPRKSTNWSQPLAEHRSIRNTETNADSEWSVFPRFC